MSFPYILVHLPSDESFPLMSNMSLTVYQITNRTMTHPIAIPPTLMTVPMYSSMFSKYNFRKYTDNMTVFLFFYAKYIGEVSWRGGYLS